jgi:hypothetical protein
MGRLCLTRAGYGTPALGLARGLALKGRARGLRPRLAFARPADLYRLGGPSVISIGVSRTAPAEIIERMREYGWEPGRHHAVVVLDADPKGEWLDVADPSFGRERWPTKDLEYLWDGRALFLSAS